MYSKCNRNLCFTQLDFTFQKTDIILESFKELLHTAIQTFIQHFNPNAVQNKLLLLCALSLPAITCNQSPTRV